jgi:hypothetical protein
MPTTGVHMPSRSRLFVAFLFLALLVVLQGAASAAVVVTNTNDSGPGSLRQAILDTNASPGGDEIDFNIPGSGVQTIAAVSPLPSITDLLFINGYTQPGASANTAPPGSALNSVILIEISGSPLQVDSGGDLFTTVIQGISVPAMHFSGGSSGAIASGNYIGVDASGTVVTGDGLSVDNATGVRVGPGNVISILTLGAAGMGTLVHGNFIGMDSSGSARLPGPPHQTRLLIDGTSGAVIGGLDPSARNIISGDAEIDATAEQTQFLGNYIGVDVGASHPLGECGEGIRLFGPMTTVVGNVIGGCVEGINVDDTDSSTAGVIQGNFIGTDGTATIDLGNEISAIHVSADNLTIGGVDSGQGNVIAFTKTRTTEGAIFLGNGNAISVRGNRFLRNAGLGIDLLGGPPDSIGVNDPEDVDAGPNTLQNYPIVTSFVPGSSSTHIEGTLNSTPSSSFDVDLYSDPPCSRRPRAPLQGEDYLGSVSVATDGFGNATFSVDVPGALGPDDLVVATATDAFGDTSEFSQRIVFTVVPLTGAANQPTPATIRGMLFEVGATVAVGGVPVPDAVATSPTTITATMPGFPAGTLHDVEVANPSGLESTLPNGWLSDFTDMPPSDIFHDSVVQLVANGIAGGIGGGNYGSANPTLRQQMAVFLLKGRHGVCYLPPACAGVFADVPCSNPFAPWIEALAAEGITAGCGGGDFCPSDPVRRDQMAVFLLKAKNGSGWAPPACSENLFLDVQCPSLFADWVNELFFEGISVGCGSQKYCPADPVIRAQMAAFVARTFQLP